MNRLTNKIEASDKNINDLLKDKKFFIDYFQREYRWEEKHMKALVEDLTAAFLKSYHASHERKEVANYQSYYLGPVVFSVSHDAKNSIIDGQQRITSITLFLIYLNNLQKKNGGSQVNIQDLIYSEDYGEKSFNMTDEDRKEVLKSLFEDGSFDSSKEEDETVININERYQDIDPVFPEDLKDKALPYFIDWLIKNVVLVKITAYSDENAYTIFETMNDRGMNLTSTEMLKGYVLSRISDRKQRNEINILWKQRMQQLHGFDANADLQFFQSWFRAKYALSMRPTKAGAENKDFELIGTRFHSWFKDNHEGLFDLRVSADFYNFFEKDFDFHTTWYMKILKCMNEIDPRCPHLFYINRWGIAPSLQEAMLLAPIMKRDSESVIYQKLDSVARFIETYTVRRAVNYKKFGSSSIRYTFFNIIKDIRNTSLEELKEKLLAEIETLNETFEAIPSFSLHQQNKKFVKHLLSRISAYIDQEVGKSTTYISYHEPETGKRFEIEHLWGNKFERHADEFDDRGEWSHWRNSIGALVLLPNGTNQSFSSDKYEDKLGHYLKENTYTQTLHPEFYKRNPNFLNSPKLKSFGFGAYEQLKKKDIALRAATVQKICEEIWNTSYYISKAPHSDL